MLADCCCLKMMLMMDLETKSGSRGSYRPRKGRGIREMMTKARCKGRAGRHHEASKVFPDLTLALSFSPSFLR